jgi:transcriptional regulator with XRE-family HTH domain
MTMNPLDLPKKIKELRAAGVTQQEIADHCGVAASTVSDWANKAAKRGPSYEAATKLIALHARKCPARRRARAPVPS